MPTNINRRVKLTMASQTLYDPLNTSTNYTFTITASDGNLMPNEIFLFQRKDPTIGYPTAVNTFVGICSPSQLSLPIDDPDETSITKFYRAASVTLTYNTAADATSAWNDILAAVELLKRSLDYADGMTSTTYWVGTPSN